MAYWLPVSHHKECSCSRWMLAPLLPSLAPCVYSRQSAELKLFLGQPDFLTNRLDIEMLLGTWTPA